MNYKKKVLAISGSVRAKSTNLEILKFIKGLTADQWDLEIYAELAELPFFNPDLDTDIPPAAVQRFREKVNAADGVLFCTPEYVFSLPGALKNAIEWTVSTTVFSNKPVAIITASSLGEKTHEALQLIMKTIYSKVIKSNTLLLSGARSKLNKEGGINDLETVRQIKLLISSFNKTMEE